MPNRLAKESSPYLLQHAHNPVDWYPWGDEALEAAMAQDKPILVSIGYAACHWCHVMERESFEDDTVAAIMNEHFINIKIDREERPDLDHIYMDAVTAMTGSGGWPLNVFLTPKGKPFYGGTYFPPVPAHGRNSWTEILEGVSRAWTERRPQILEQAENLTSHIEEGNKIGALHPSIPPSLHPDQLDIITTELLKSADRQQGGFGRAPKFPQTGIIAFLLRYGMDAINNSSAGQPVDPSKQEALQQAFLSIDKMIQGGIYDQIGGGLARYSTDNNWLVPHFEKMLYDQALLISVLADACQLAGLHSERGREYARVIDHTIAFLRRELMSSEGGFYAALDADSEGEEGKFYVWEKGEIEDVLGNDAPIAVEWFGVSGEGNWEGINILTREKTVSELANSFGLSLEETLTKVDSISSRLMERRSTRIRPALDDKQILAWNALMNMAISKAAGATGSSEYRQLAIENMDWMLRVFAAENGQFYHTYKDGQAKYPAFLDDLAYLVQALIYLQELTGDTIYIERAAELTTMMKREFGTNDNHLFYYTGASQHDVVVRKREIYDGAQPSGNAVMAFNLQWLGLVLDRAEWKLAAENMLTVMAGVVTRYPASFGYWAVELMRAIRGCEEIVVAGPRADVLRNEILANFIPFRVLQSTTRENEAYPLLRHKFSAPDTAIHVCHNYSCARPVATVREMLALIKEGWRDGVMEERQ